MNIFRFQINLQQLKTSRKDEISSLITQFWRLIAGPLSLLFISLFLSAEDQGFWYTFAGLSALGVFADLGFTTIILQFSAHEYAFLKFADGKLEGDEYHLERISSLFKFVLKWTTVMVLIVFPIITVIGIIMFSGKSDSNYWLLPWVIYLIASVGNFICAVISSFFQGCEQVAKNQRIILFSSIATTITLIPLLYFNAGLYALSLSLLAGVFVYGYFLYKNYRKLILQLLGYSSFKGSWKKELLPLLGKYAVSWSSGYFSFQIYAPLVFQFKGAVEAGKVGITMSLINAIYSISFIWFVAKTPKLNILVAEKNWLALDKLFKKTLFFSASTYLLGMGTLLAVVLLFTGRWELFDRIKLRFLDLTPLAMLSLGWFFQIFVSGSAAYLRAHKKEVYMYVSLLGGFYIILTTFLSIRFLPGEYLFLGFLTSYMIFGVVEYKIFKQCRLVWHQKQSDY